MKSQQRQLITKYLHPLVCRWKLIAVCLLIAAVTGLLVYLRSPRVYRSEALISYEYRQGYSEGVTREQERQRLEKRVSTVADLVTSHITLTQLIGQFDLYPESRHQLSPEDTVEMMRNRIQIAPGRFTISISFTGDRPDAVMEVTNALAVQFIEKNYVYLESGKTLSATSSEMQGYLFEIADFAHFPDKPYLPDFFMIMLSSLAAGLGVGVILAYAAGVFDPSLKDAEEVEQYLALPVVCSISHLKCDAGVARKRTSDLCYGARDERLAMASSAMGTVCESFCTLRARILYPMHGTPPKSLLVTSAGSGEGKSFVCASLGISFSRGIDNHAILVDADLRSPSLADLFGHANNKGLVNFLRGEQDIAGLLTGLEAENMYLMPAGLPPLNPGELLDSESIAGLVSELSRCYDNRIIIFDAPSLDSAAETAQLARHVDAVILVVRWGTFRKRHIKSMIEQIGKEKIAGVVLNGYRQTILENKFFR